jgi:2-polyprenyl-6-methoxyphenol hydroxylase-like FAD-dependent oxidoreductase
MAKAIKGGLPEVLRDRFTSVVSADGVSFGLLPMVFKNPPRQVWSELDDVEDYYMSVFNLHRDALGMSDNAFFGLSGSQLCEFVLDRTIGWHDDLRGVFDHAEPDETYPIALHAAVPVTAWEPGNVVPLGDAVHAMPPSGGVGANTAARDASALCRALTAVDRGERPLPEAVGEYQAEMVRYGTEAVTMSLRMAKGSMKIDWDESES